jgi:preprotein translocase subunit SecG
MWDLVKAYPRTTAWVVAVWMVTVLVLLVVGPVVRP